MADIQRLRRFSIFAGLRDDDLSPWADKFTEEKHERGDPKERAEPVIYRQDQAAERFYLVEAGRLAVYRRGERQDEQFRGVFLSGDFCGAEEILKSETRASTVQVVKDAVLLSMERSDFLEMCAKLPDFRIAVEKAIARRAMQRPLDVARLRQFKFLASMSDGELAKWLPYFDIEMRPRNEIIFREGEPGDRFYMIERGQVAVNHSRGEGRYQFLGYYIAGEFFGENALLKNEPRFATIDVVSEVTLLCLDREDFLEFYKTHHKVQKAIDEVATERIRRRVRTFPGKRDDEALVMSVHRHILWFLVRAGIWSAVFVPLLLILGALAANALLPLIILLGAVYVLGLGWYWIDWLNDWFIVSSRRVMHHERVIFLFQQVAEAPIDKVQNVTSDVPNLLANIFDFGDVTIQTAAGGGRILFDFVPRSRVIRDAIESEKLRLAEHNRQRETIRTRQIIRRELQQEMDISPDVLAAQAEGSSVVVTERSGVLRRIFGGFHIIAPTYVRKNSQVIWRKHVLILLVEIITPLLFFMASLVFCLFMLYSNFTGGALLSLPVTLLLVVLLMPISGFWLWYVYRDWENDIYVLTPDRLIDSERKPLWLQERVRVASLAQVQNVTFKRENIIQNLLNFGTVLIQTAGQDSGLTFDNIPRPGQAQQQITDALERFREREREREREVRRREFRDWFGEYNKLLSENPPRPDQSQGGQKTPV